MAIYMKFEEGTLPPKGEATTKGHEDWLEILSFQHGIARPVDSGATGRSRSLSASQFSDVTASAQVSKASNPLMTAVANGTVYKKVTIEFCRAGGEAGRSEEAYMIWTMSDVIVSSYQSSGASDGRPMESFSLNFTKVENKYLSEDLKTGKLSTANTFVFDTTKGSVG